MNRTLGVRIMCTSKVCVSSPTTDRPEEDREASDIAGVPLQRLAHQIGIDVVERDAGLRDVVEQVLQQELLPKRRIDWSRSVAPVKD
jgi:hypothetical protein